MSLSYIKRAEQGNRSALSFIATILLSVGGLIIGQSMPIYVAIYLKKTLNGEQPPIASDLNSMTKLMGHFPYYISFIFLMMGFVFLLFMVWFGVRYIHRRIFATLWSDRDRFRWPDFLKGAGFTFALMLISHAIILIGYPGEYKWVFKPEQFYPFLIVALILVPIQTLSEEVFFRGYLYQAFGTLTNHYNQKNNWKLNAPWISLALSGICFGTFHFNNPEMDIDFWKVATVYIGSGLMIGLSVVLSGGIEFGWGYHLINNLSAFLIVTFPGSASPGPTLYLADKPSANYVLTEFLITFVIFTIALLIFYRKNIKTLFNRET